MCLDCDERSNSKITRRIFLTGASAVIAGIATGGNILAQQALKKALDDPKISHKTITFRSGADTIEGFLARPKAAGRYKAIIVTHGNADLPEDIRNTAAQLAQEGFVALAVNPTSRYPDMSKFPRELLRTNKFGVLMMEDIRAGIDYLKTLSFVKVGGVGMVGFCGGGIVSVMFAALSREVESVVVFYAAPFVNAANNTLDDPRPHMLSFVQWVEAPIQAHFGTNDPYLPTADAKRFEE